MAWNAAAATHREAHGCLGADALRDLARRIRADRRFTTNNLNRDFVGTRGFSVVFHGAGRERVAAEFPFFEPYLRLALLPDCNAFYLNPLELRQGSRVDPHIDRSLRSYCKDIHVPLRVSVLYLEVPNALRGGRLVLARGRKVLARIAPAADLLVEFAGDLTHSIERVDTDGARLSLVCEQYALEPEELAQVPEFAIESRLEY